MPLIDELRAPMLLNYIRKLPVEPYLGDELFPERTVNELGVQVPGGC